MKKKFENIQEKDTFNSVTLLQLKSDELIASHELAGNRLVSVERMAEDALRVGKEYCVHLSEFTKKEENFQHAHSIDETKAVPGLKKEFKLELENPGR